MIDEGYIKFHCKWTEAAPPTGIDALVSVRNELYQLGLIGVYQPEGIGFGNISQKLGTGKFAISCSATGLIPVVGPEHFCVVDTVSIEENTVHCYGPAPASSESMTHAMIYSSDPTIKAVIHAHSKPLWEYMLKNFPFTAKDVPYGTPEMAKEVIRLFENSELAQLRAFAMAGHDEGIVTFGSKIEEARGVLIKILAKTEPC